MTLLSASGRAATTLSVPRVINAPRLEDFEDMAPHGAAAGLERVTGFMQNQPSDGKPATERTDAYLGYDQRNLYIVMVCWQKMGCAPT